MSNVKEATTMSSITLVMFFLYKHPMLLVGALTFQTIPTMIMINSLKANNWMSYLLFLIFLGGLLIIFVYLAAIIPNEMFKPSHTLYPVPLVIMWLLMKNTSHDWQTKESMPKETESFSLLLENTLFIFMLVYLIVCLNCTMFILNYMKSPLKMTT